MLSQRRPTRRGRHDEKKRVFMERVGLDKEKGFTCMVKSENKYYNKGLKRL